MKRLRILDFISSSHGATIEQICRQFNCTKPNARQHINYLRNDGHGITTERDDKGKATYFVTSVAKPKAETNMDQLRTILSTYDEWTCEEIAEMTKLTTTQVSNAIGFLRRDHDWKIKTRQIGHHSFSYQLESKP